MSQVLLYVFVLFKTFVRIKMPCVKKQVEALRGENKEDLNCPPNFDLVRFLPYIDS